MRSPKDGADNRCVAEDEDGYFCGTEGLAMGLHRSGYCWFSKFAGY